MSGTSWARNH